MIYKIERTISGFFTEYGITSEDDDLMFIVNSQFMAGKRRIRLFDIEDNELFRVEQILPSFEPAFNIYIKDQHIGQIKKIFDFNDIRFQIVSRYGPYIIEGDTLSNEYLIINSDLEPVAAVSEEFFDEEEVYGVEIDEGEDDVFLLALMTVVDFLLN